MHHAVLRLVQQCSESEPDVVNKEWSSSQCRQTSGEQLGELLSTESADSGPTRYYYRPQGGPSDLERRWGALPQNVFGSIYSRFTAICV